MGGLSREYEYINRSELLSTNQRASNQLRMMRRSGENEAEERMKRPVDPITDCESNC